MSDSHPTKGELAEEALREYFIELGLFVCRGLKVNHNSAEISDVDLWLYCKPTPFNRQITIVDIKNKKQSEALLRINWTVGLQKVLKADQAIVATGEKGTHIRQFAEANGIHLIDGHLLQSVMARYKAAQSRITEEDMWDALRAHKDPVRKGWLERYASAKSRLLASRNFDGCNAWLEDAKFFAEAVYTNPTESVLAIRLLYMCCAYFLVGLDFRLHRTAFLSSADRNEIISNGFKFGETGIAGIEQLIDRSLGIIGVSKITLPPAPMIRDALIKEVGKIPTEILAQFISKPEVQRDLFSMAVELENTAFSKALKAPNELSVGVRSLLAVLLDFWRLDRRLVLDWSFHKPKSQQMELIESLPTSDPKT